MEEKDPLKQMINQLTDMVQLIESKKIEDVKLPPGIVQILEDMKQQMESFRRTTEETLRELGLSKEEMKKRIENPSILKGDEKKKLEELISIEKKTRQMQVTFQETLQKIEKKEKKAAAVGHRKRYKRLGGDDKWKSI